MGVLKGCNIDIFEWSIEFFRVQKILISDLFSFIGKIPVYKICQYANCIDGLDVGFGVDKKRPYLQK